MNPGVIEEKYYLHVDPSMTFIKEYLLIGLEYFIFGLMKKNYLHL